MSRRNSSMMYNISPNIPVEDINSSVKVGSVKCEFIEDYFSLTWDFMLKDVIKYLEFRCKTVYITIENEVPFCLHVKKNRSGLWITMLRGSGSSEQTAELDVEISFSEARNNPQHMRMTPLRNILNIWYYKKKLFWAEFQRFQPLYFHRCTVSCIIRHWSTNHPSSMFIPVTNDSEMLEKPSKDPPSVSEERGPVVVSTQNFSIVDQRIANRVNFFKKLFQAKNIKTEIADYMIRYIINEELPRLKSFDEGLDIYTAAKNFNLPVLANWCEYYFDEMNIDEKNCLFVLKNFRQMRECPFFRKAMKVFVYFINNICESTKWKQLKEDDPTICYLILMDAASTDGDTMEMSQVLAEMEVHRNQA